MRYLKLSIIILAIGLIAFFSCKDDEDTTPALSVNVSEAALDDDLISSIEDDIFAEADAEEIGLKSANAVLCRVVEKKGDFKKDTATITITYNGECEFMVRNRTRTRSGQIIIKRYGGVKWLPGSTKVVSFNNFYIDSVKVEGTRKIVGKGVSADTTSISYEVITTAGKLTFPKGIVVEHSGIKTLTYYTGGTVGNFSDDYLLVNGTTSGKNFKGQTYQRVLTDIKIMASCRWIVSGTVAITNSELGNFSINYGNGSCDDKVIIKKDDKEHEISLQIKRIRK